jgi:two-component system response regulator PilR (NtrC family)
MSRTLSAWKSWLSVATPRPPLDHPQAFSAHWLTRFRIFIALSALVIIHFASTLLFAPVAGVDREAWLLSFGVYLLFIAVPHFRLPYELRRIATLGAYLIDLCAITGLVYLTGGPFSPFLFLFLPVVGFVAATESRRAGLWCSAIGIGLYSLLAGALQVGALALVDGTVLHAGPPGGLLLQIIGLGSGMILTVIGASFLALRMTAQSVIAASSTALAVEQRELLEQIPDGIIRLRLDGTIEYLNEAAATLLGATSDRLRGRSLRDYLIAHGADTLIELLPSESLCTTDLTITAPNSNETRHFSCIARPCYNRRHELVGAFIILRDMTTLRTAQEQLEIQERMARLLATTDADESFQRHSTRVKGFVGESAVMQRIFTLIERVAKFDATVLISGESGTGKELVARAIHLGSAYASGPFVAVNCGAIPEALLESELFGHKRGAFTGAESEALGLFRRADGGTIFLDEIGELPLSMQAKLLRVVQEKQVRPVGGDSDIPIRVRVIAATNRNLRAEVRAARFREDLFYRLNVVSIALPPLRDRREDIPPLVDSLLRQLCRGKAALPVVPPATMQALMGYNYPGNVRELENVLERALVFGGEVILPEHLAEQVRGLGTASVEEPPPQRETEIIFANEIQFPLDLDAILADTERRYLELALVQTNGAKKKAADLLGLNFRSFRYRLQKFNIASEGD